MPLIQHWDCHACGHCCTDYQVPVTAEERARIMAQGWESEPDFQGVPLFVRASPWWQFWRRDYRLNQRAGDRCVFLNEKGLCRIHAQHGFETKPLACRLYPYILVPAGKEYRLSMRFACPSVAANRGRPVAAQADDLRALGEELETWGRSAGQSAREEDVPPPPLTRGRTLGWPELQALLDAWQAIINDASDPFPRRWLRALRLLDFLKRAKTDDLKGTEFRKLLMLLLPTVSVDVPTDLERVGPPSWVGRVLFRTTAAIYLRKDSGVRTGLARRGRLALMLAMVRMLRGRGRLPELQRGLPDRGLDELEEPLGPLTAESNAVLARYYSIKLESLQFCGSAFFGLPVDEGLRALALTLAVILWLARGCRDLGQPESVYKAMTVVDENFGYNPLLGQFRQRWSMRILAERGELEKVLVWMSR
ncbi:MAG TPA: YkgJ family cysteine cluster protein [Gemmatales bacterium]|nr:YkgJ family cysteine cluster protein [Gemmatales bacterium]